MKNYIKEIILGSLIAFSLIVHFFDLLNDSMMFSGIIVIIILGYITTLFQEKTSDERDEYIRNKTNRYLFVLTTTLLLLIIIFKIFTHIDYKQELLLLTIIAFAKIVLNKFLTDNN